MANDPKQMAAGACPPTGLNGTFASQQHLRDYTNATAGDTQQLVDMSEHQDVQDNDEIDDEDLQ